MSSTARKEGLRKAALFKGTIIVSVVYAVISVVLLLGIRYTTIGEGFAGESNFPFAITFTLGMLVIIGILVFKILTFKEEKRSIKLYDEMMCPDFWKLQKTDAATLNGFVPEQKTYMNYKCTKPADKPGIVDPVIDLSSDSTTDYDIQLADAARFMYGAAATEVKDANNLVQPNKVKIKCDSIYPKYMSSQDISKNPDTQNSMRCAYANKCGLTWSSVCQDN